MYRRMFFLFICFCFVGCVEKNKFLDEVNMLPKPVGFEPISIDSLVEKYFKRGLNKEKVLSIFNEYNFLVMGQEKIKSDSEFAKCDPIILVGVYEIKKLFSPVAGYKVVVYVGFENGISSVLKGYYLKHMY